MIRPSLPMAVTGCGSSPANTPSCRISSRRVSAAKRLAQGFVGGCGREALKPSIQVALPLLRRQYRRGRVVPMEVQALADGFDAHLDNVARIGDRARLLDEVYGAGHPDYDSMPAQALHEVVKVDLNITGCPIEKEEFVAAIASLLNGDAPLAVEYPVCTECRMRENNCLLTERGEICCGPLTVAGCGARCPELRIGCVGCRGPVADANSASLVAEFEQRGFARQDIAARLRTFAPQGVAS